MEKKCVVCGRPFIANTRRKVCSEECRKKKDTMYHRKWVAEHLEENRAYMREERRTGIMHEKKGVKHHGRNSDSK